MFIVFAELLADMAGGMVLFAVHREGMPTACGPVRSRDCAAAPKCVPGMRGGCTHAMCPPHAVRHSSLPTPSYGVNM